MSDTSKRTPDLLRAAIAACFLCHGVLAIQNSTIYFSEWNVWIQRLFGSEDLSVPKYFLRVVGSIDLLTGCAVLLWPKIPRVFFVWAIGWGFATAWSRFYFLGSLSGTFWYDIVRPISEIVERTPTWVLPIMLYNRQRVAGERRILAKITESQWIAFAVASVVLGEFLHYVIEFNNPLYPLEVVKTGVPLWLFHAAGTVAWLTIAALGATLLLRRLPAIKVAALLAVACALLTLCVEVVFINGPHGFSYTALRLGEHFTIYFCFGYLAASAYSRRRPTRLWRWA